MPILSLLLAGAIAVTPIYLVHLTILGIPIYLPEIFIILASVVWTFLVTSRAIRPLWPPRRLVIFCLLFLLGAVFATWQGGVESVGPLKSWVVLPLIFGFFTYQVLLSFPRSRTYFDWALLVTAVAVSAEGFLMMFARGGRLESFFNSPNSAAMWLVPIFFILFPRKNHWFFGAGLLLMLTAIFLTNSFGGLTGLVIGMLILLAARGHKKSPPYLPTIVGVALGLFVLLSLTPFLGELLEPIFGVRLGGRLQIWEIGRLAISHQPFFGLGPGIFERYYFSIVGSTFPTPIEWNVPEPHNLYLATWISSGLVGFIGFLGLAYDVLSRQIKAKKPELLAALSAILVHGLVDTPYWKNDLAIIFFLVIALSFGQPSEKKSFLKEG